MTSKFLDPESFRRLARRGDAAGATLTRDTTGPIAAPIDGSRRVSWILSDGSVDRQGDVITPSGWKLDDFKRNNVVLWAHNSAAPPIGRALNVRVQNDRLIGEIEFAPADVSEFADSVFRLVRAGYLRAGSVGFLPTKWKFSDDKSRPMGINFLEQQLLEFSICSVPANSAALALASAKGIDVRPIKRWLMSKDGEKPKPLTPRCGRGKDESCGLKNPSECTVHGAPTDAGRSHRTPRVRGADNGYDRVKEAARMVLETTPFRIASAQNEVELRRALDRRDQALRDLRGYARAS